MSALEQVLWVVYLAGLGGGLIIGLLAGIILTFIWVWVRRQRRNVQLDREYEDYRRWVDSVTEDLQGLDEAA